ncbi:hypothetical protein [Desertivirga xinjiangensis]|uniref:hypothetical protein n=1 Tax=Desertivirga xinjiangensis TaxID=539206 RepID=UPI00210EEBD5|nr:hypothetical protein [Pedobacter xinjiangensis]
MKLMLKTNKVIWLISWFAGLVLLSACKKAENYYGKLDAQPEILLNYQPVYGVGDTLTIDGRLNPQADLRIKIGNADAKIISAEKIEYKTSESSGTVYDVIDRVKVIITSQMGLGKDKVVTLISGGSLVKGTSIQIIESSSSGILPSALQLVKHADARAAGTVYLYCQNGKGSIYSWRSDKKIYKISKNGNLSVVMDASTLSDSFGAFQISTFSAGGVDARERYLYFAAITTDGSADNASNEIYRLCCYDLQSGTLTTLNRTLFPTEANRRTTDVYTPFQGSLNTSKLMNISGLYPGDEGKIYLTISEYALARIDSDGRLKYLFHLGVRYLPVIWNPQTNSSYSSDYVNGLIPGVDANGLSVLAISPEEDILYCRSGSSDIIQLDLLDQVQLYQFSPGYVRTVSGNETPYISGSFDILTGITDGSGVPSLFGNMPMDGENILILYHQRLDNYPNNKFYSQYPAFGQVNFRDQAGKRYAPGKLKRNGYTMNTADLMLNYDEEGMIYMTANNKAVIVKTTNQ